MLPLQQAQELRAAISEYLKATFTFREQKVHDAFHSFINHPKDGMFKGPYVSIICPLKKQIQMKRSLLKFALNSLLFCISQKHLSACLLLMVSLSQRC